MEHLNLPGIGMEHTNEPGPSPITASIGKPCGESCSTTESSVKRLEARVNKLQEDCAFLRRILHAFGLATGIAAIRDVLSEEPDKIVVTKVGVK